LVKSWQETGEIPLWCPYNFGGMPFVHDIQVSAFYPPHWPLFVLPPDWLGAATSWLVVLHVIAAGWCMFAYARHRGLERYGTLGSSCQLSVVSSQLSKAESQLTTDNRQLIATHYIRWAGLGAWTALVAVGLAAVQLLPGLEASASASRSTGVAVSTQMLLDGL